MYNTHPSTPKLIIRCSVYWGGSNTAGKTKYKTDTHFNYVPYTGSCNPPSPPRNRPHPLSPSQTLPRQSDSNSFCCPTLQRAVVLNANHSRLGLAPRPAPVQPRQQRARLRPFPPSKRPHFLEWRFRLGSQIRTVRSALQETSFGSVGWKSAE